MSKEMEALEVFEQIATTSVLADRVGEWTDLKTALPQSYEVVRTYLSAPSAEDVVEIIKNEISLQLGRHDFFQTQYDNCESSDKKSWLDKASSCALIATKFDQLLYEITALISQKEEAK